MPRSRFLRESIATLPSSQRRRPRHHIKTRRPNNTQLQGLPPDSKRKRSHQRISQGTSREKLYHRVQFPLRILFLLSNEERRKTPTHYGPPFSKLIYRPRHIPTPPHQRYPRTTSGEETFH